MRHLTIQMTYAGSAADEAELPAWARPEVAVAGRSNCGKSSLLNCLAGRRGLAHVSRTPGRTRRLQFFACAHDALAFVLVDLPGYGFARASRREQAEWGRAVERYLTSRPNLRALAILADVRRGPSDDERMLERLCRDRGLGVVRVATKVDKLGRSERVRHLHAFQDAEWIPFSARTGEGRERVVAALMAAIEGRS